MFIDLKPANWTPFAPNGMTGVLSGAAVGAVNGIGFVYGRLPHAFIITLATLSICRGLALELAIGHTTMRGMPAAIAAIGGSSTLGIPNSFFIVLGVALLILLMAKAMVWGRWIYAVGGQPEAAVEMGIPVKGVLVSTYVISGLCAGIGAVLLAGRTEAGSPLYGNLLELDTIAAVIIGGASFLGGRGHIGHALVGAVMIGVIRNALNLLGVDVFFQMIAIGLVIVDHGSRREESNQVLEEVARIHPAVFWFVVIPGPIATALACSSTSERRSEPPEAVPLPVSGSVTNTASPTAPCTTGKMPSGTAAAAIVPSLPFRGCDHFARPSATSRARIR